jgi:hypothetical protein
MPVGDAPLERHIQCLSDPNASKMLGVHAYFKRATARFNSKITTCSPRILRHGPASLRSLRSPVSHWPGRSVPLPRFEMLECKVCVEKWSAAKNECTTLKDALPDEFLRVKRTSALNPQSLLWATLKKASFAVGVNLGFRLPPIGAYQLMTYE